MDLCNSPDFFQEKMKELFNGLEYFRTYIDDLLIINNKPLYDHVCRLYKALTRFKAAGFKVNAEKSFFDRNELEYLGFKMTSKV